LIAVMPERQKHPVQPAARLSCPGVRQALLVLGWACVALGVAGLFLPVMPTTVFLLVAAWAFSRSSHRFHRWLFDHPRLGRTVRAWHEHRVIPVRAKLLAVSMMAASVAVLALFVAAHWALPVAVGALLAGIAGYILSRPSAVPAEQ
jgi:uncharacterized membrane protein YbaN (DUF454 family)